MPAPVLTTTRPATTFTELLPELAAAKAGPAQPFTPQQLQHLFAAVGEHARSCDCPSPPGFEHGWKCWWAEYDCEPERHREHTPRSIASLVDEALYDLAQTPYPPHDARITCGECGTTHATEGDYAAAMHRLTAADGVPADAWWGQCTGCPKDVNVP